MLTETQKKNGKGRLSPEDDWLKDFQNKTTQWTDSHSTTFTVEQRRTTTILTTGLPVNTIRMVASALKPLGMKVEAFKAPGNSALEVGREYGNRAQCNPTYFTVGSLIEYLIDLRDKQGIPTRQIIEKYIYVTAGGCGPCRMGMYATEYRKALRDSGFQGFRVILITRSGESSSVDSSGLAIEKRELLRAFTGLIFGDIITSLTRRIQPYELVPGSTETAVGECRNIIEDAMENGKSKLRAAYRCGKIIKKIKVDKLQARPRVLIQGEFWAKTTEGEGNYNLFDFLEKEGAEAVNETVSDWLLHQIWRKKWATDRREELSFYDNSGDGLKGVSIKKLRLALWAGDRLIRGLFYSLSALMGLKNAHLTDHEHLGELAHDYFDKHLDGGEDLMEIGHHIHTVTSKEANMVLSVKPFTCLSSNGVSDGIQPIISEKFPDSIFASVETNGDAPANFYSRIQMQLFKAKKAAAAEVDSALEAAGMTLEEVQEKLKKYPALQSPTHISPHLYACETANLIREVAGK